MRHANSAFKIYLYKLNLIRPASAENLQKKCDGVTFCGPAISW